MGPTVLPQFERYGFYASGGGRFCAPTLPSKAPKPFQIGERSEIISRPAIGAVANRPRQIAQSEVETSGRMANWGPECFSVEESRDSASPGNIATIEIGSSEVIYSRRLVRSERRSGDRLPALNPQAHGLSRSIGGAVESGGMDRGSIEPELSGRQGCQTSVCPTGPLPQILFESWPRIDYGRRG
jgi:hypothetical protein